MGHRLSILTAVALAAGGSACGSTAGAVQAPRTADAPVPSVPLHDLSGAETDVARLAGGRVALVSMWATWCEACQKEMDALNRLDASTAAGHDALVVGIDVGEDPETVVSFAKRRGLRYAQLLDPDFVFADALGQRRVPATLVVDRHGRIVFRGDALDAASLEALRNAVSSRE